MSFIKRNVKDRVVQYPHRYQLVEVQPGIFDLIPVTGTVTEEGTPINKAYLQPIEDGINVLDAEVDAHKADLMSHSKVLGDDGYVYTAIVGDVFGLGGISESYGGTIYGIETDSKFVYIGGQTTFTIKKYLIDGLKYIGESPSYGGLIRTMDSDSDYVYIGGTKTSATVRKYDKETLSYKNESMSFGASVYTVRIDGEFIYANGADYTIKKLNKFDLSLVGTSPSFGAIVWDMAFDNDFIYAIGDFTSGKKIKKYNKSNLQFVSESAPFVANTGTSIIVDDNFVYAGFENAKPINKYDKTNLSLLATSPTLNGNCKGILPFGNSVLCATSADLYEIKKTDMSLVFQSNVEGGIESICKDDLYMFTGGNGVGAYITKIKLYNTILGLRRVL